MEMLAEFLHLGWDINTLKKRRGEEGGHPCKWRPAPLLRILDMKQEINAWDTSFPSDLLYIPVQVKTEGGKTCECSVPKLDPR